MDSINLYTLYQGKNLKKFGKYQKVLSNSCKKGREKKTEIKTLIFLIEKFINQVLSLYVE